MSNMESEIADPPYKAVFETAGVCNLKCPACYIGAGRITPRGSYMDMDMFEKICEEVEGFVTHAYLQMWGEPTLNPNIGKMIKRVRKFATVDLATHGMFVTEEMAVELNEATSLSVSIDGIGQEVYEIYRVKGDYEKAMRGLKLLAKERQRQGKNKVNWTWVVHKQNEHQIPEAQRMGDAMGVNFGAKSPFLIDEDTLTNLHPSEKKYQRYDGEGLLLADRYACREFWETIYFFVDGNIATCGFDFNGRWYTGNANDESVLDIWNGEKYRQMRRQHLAGELNELCATQCGMGP